MKRIRTAVAALALVPAMVPADEIVDGLDRVRELSAAGIYPQAMKMADGVQKELRKRHAQKLMTFLPDAVAGFRAEPAPSETSSGANAVSRSYRKSELAIEASIQEFSATQRAMLDMAQWGMRMGAQMMSERLNLEGCPANLESRPGQDTATMMVELANNARLRLELRGSDDGGLLKTFAGALKLGELDRYLRGMQDR